MKCYGCNKEYSGNDHHCDEKFENRSEGQRNADRDECEPLYGSRLEIGFLYMSGCER